jgi:hypothetical protein
VFENRVLRRIFGPRRDEARGGYNEKLNKLYSPPSTGCGKLTSFFEYETPYK